MQRVFFFVSKKIKFRQQPKSANLQAQRCRWRSCSRRCLEDDDAAAAAAAAAMALAMVAIVAVAAAACA